MTKTLLLVFFALSFPLKVLSCACCADEGTWFVDRYKITDGEYIIEAISGLQFDGQSAAREDGMLERGGINGKVKAQFLGRNLHIEIQDAETKKITAIEFVPTEIERFHTDQGLPLPPNGMGIDVYKEVRLYGKVKGLNLNSEKTVVVIQGFGNNCNNASDFKHWIIRIPEVMTIYGTFQQLSFWKEGNYSF